MRGAIAKILMPDQDSYLAFKIPFLIFKLILQLTKILCLLLRFVFETMPEEINKNNYGKKFIDS